MKSQAMLSAREALKVPIPRTFEVEAPYRLQIAQMEEQNKTAGILLIAIVVFAGAAIIYLAASKAKAWQLDTEKKS
jgi:hypothetical protein